MVWKMSRSRPRARGSDPSPARCPAGVEHAEEEHDIDFSGATPLVDRHARNSIWPRARRGEAGRSSSRRRVDREHASAPLRFISMVKARVAPDVRTASAHVQGMGARTTSTSPGSRPGSGRARSDAAGCVVKPLPTRHPPSFPIGGRMAVDRVGGDAELMFSRHRFGLVICRSGGAPQGDGRDALPVAVGVDGTHREDSNACR